LLFHRYHRPHSIKNERHVLEPKNKEQKTNQTSKQTINKKKQKKRKQKIDKQTNTPIPQQKPKIKPPMNGLSVLDAWQN